MNPNITHLNQMGYQTGTIGEELYTKKKTRTKTIRDSLN